MTDVKEDMQRGFGEIKETIHEIKVDVKKQNGRVRKLEVNGGIIKGGLAIISAIILPIAFIVISNLIK